MEDRRVLSTAHTEKANAVLGMEDGEVMWVPFCWLTHKYLAIKRKGSGCLKGMKWAPHISV